jgi:hypothetical protein
MQIPTFAGHAVIAAATALLLAPALPAAQTLPPAEPSARAVDFAPAAAAKMQRYGKAERATLRSAIVSAVSHESSCRAIPAGLTVSVTVDNVAPTRPTAKQLGDDPSLDVVRTKYLGGAELTGEVRDASQRVVATVTYRYFPQTLALGSVSRDPWADARLAIEGFADKLAAACRDLSRRGTPPSANSAAG